MRSRFAALESGRIDSWSSFNVDATQGPNFVGVPAKALAAFRAVGRPMAPDPSPLVTRAHFAQSPTMTTDAPPVSDSMLGRIADALEKLRGRSVFGSQGAHAESADEFGALFDDVQSAGLSGVDRLKGAPLVTKVTKTRECLPGVVLESHSRRVKQQLRELPEEAWSFSRYNEKVIQGHCGHLKTLRRIVLEAAAVEHGFWDWRTQKDVRTCNSLHSSSQV